MVLSRALIAGLIALAVPHTVVGQGRVQVELVTESGLALAGTQQWLQLFADVPGVEVRVRAGERGERPKVENRGDARHPSYLVVGVLRGDQLLLPASRPLTLRDKAAAAQWIQQLRAEGMEGLTAERAAFDLTKDELLQLNQHLQRVVTMSTAGVRAGDVARQLVALSGLEFDVSAEARRQFGSDLQVQDELKGLSCGTALAAAIRPLGLAVAPRKQAGQLQLHLAAASELEESLPVGWPITESPFQAAPALFQYLTFEIGDVPLQQALDALSQRVADVPFIVDRRALAEAQVDLQQTKVSFPRKRTFYKKVLDHLLFKARLSSELRADENGRVFLWITQ